MNPIEWITGPGKTYALIGLALVAIGFLTWAYNEVYNAGFNACRAEYAESDLAEGQRLAGVGAKASGKAIDRASESHDRSVKRGLDTDEIIRQARTAVPSGQCIRPVIIERMRDHHRSNSPGEGVDQLAPSSATP